jgi:hypothetical protein
MLNLNLRGKLIIMEDKKSSCGLRKKDKLGCCGNCWLNVGGIFDVWEIISKKCNGSKKEQQILNEMFDDKRDRKEILNKYTFTKDEKEILDELWF